MWFPPQRVDSPQNFLLKEALILTHQHLVFQSLHSFQSNTHHDDDRGTADGNGVIADDAARDQGQIATIPR